MPNTSSVEMTPFFLDNQEDALKRVQQEREALNKAMKEQSSLKSAATGKYLGVYLQQIRLRQIMQLESIRPEDKNSKQLEMLGQTNTFFKRLCENMGISEINMEKMKRGFMGELAFALASKQLGYDVYNPGVEYDLKHGLDLVVNPGKADLLIQVKTGLSSQNKGLEMLYITGNKDEGTKKTDIEIATENHPGFSLNPNSLEKLLSLAKSKGGIPAVALLSTNMQNCYFGTGSGIPGKSLIDELALYTRAYATKR